MACGISEPCRLSPCRVLVKAKYGGVHLHAPVSTALDSLTRWLFLVYPAFGIVESESERNSSISARSGLCRVLATSGRSDQVEAQKI
eukprot:6192099-Pleurochrysis_carterae.AAC.2